MNLALTVLLTGLTVVFSVLILLTIVIKVYGLIISKIQNKATKPNTNSIDNVIYDDDNDDIDQEVLAVIFAAVAHMYSDDSKYKIKSVKRVFTSRPAWGNASIIENTKPF